MGGKNVKCLSQLKLKRVVESFELKTKVIALKHHSELVTFIHLLHKPHTHTHTRVHILRLQILVIKQSLLPSTEILIHQTDGKQDMVQRSNLKSLQRANSSRDTIPAETSA